MQILSINKAILLPASYARGIFVPILYDNTKLNYNQYFQ